MQQLSPLFVKKVPHAVSGSPYIWIILIEFFTVLEYQIHVNHKTVQIWVPVIDKKNK